VFRLIADYLRRTLGVWVIVWFLHTMQAAAFFASGRPRVPLVGAVVAALAFVATFDSSQSVMRTLPIKRRDLALTRWWVAVAWPIVLCAFCIFGGWWANGTRGFPRPELASLGSLVLICASTIGALAVLPMPSLSPGQRKKYAAFVVVWGALTVVSLRGVPFAALSSTGWAVVMACGFLFGLMSLVRAMQGEALTVNVPFAGALAQKLKRERVATSSRLRGWSVLGEQLLRTTVLLTGAGVVGVSALRFYVPELDAAKAYQTATAMAYISVIGVAAGVLVSRWLSAVRVMQILPVRDAALTFMICLALVMPPLITCMATSAIHAVFPMWGVHIPAFIYPFFAIFPALFVPTQSPAASGGGFAPVVQQWSPIFQLAVWPLWIGGFTSLALIERMPTWFGVIGVCAGIGLAIGGFLLVYGRIRSGAGLEHKAGPLATR
jgi:hypothetical protein